MLTFPNAITRRVPVTRLAHSENVAGCVSSTSRDLVDFPLTPQRRIAAARVVGASLHGAFAPTTSPLVYIFAERHIITSFLF